MLKKEKFQTRTFTIFTQTFSIAENLTDCFGDSQHLVPLHKRIQAHSQMRIRGKSAANPDGETDFPVTVVIAHRGRERKIINFRIAAPVAAAADADLVLARQVIKVRIADK